MGVLILSFISHSFNRFLLNSCRDVPENLEVGLVSGLSVRRGPRREWRADQTGPWGHIIDLVLYPQRNGEPLSGYQQGNNTIIVVFQKEFSQKVGSKLNVLQ